MAHKPLLFANGRSFNNSGTNHYGRASRDATRRDAGKSLEIKSRKKKRKRKLGGGRTEVKDKTNVGEKADVPAVTDDDKDSSSQQVDDTHTTAQASPPLQKSRRILSASSDFFFQSVPLYLKSAQRRENQNEAVFSRATISNDSIRLWNRVLYIT